MKRLKAFFAALGFAILLASPSMAWDVKDMNQTVDQTNFSVDGGCSGTLISLKHRLVLTNFHCVDGKVKFREKEVVKPDGTVQKKKVVDYRDVNLSQTSYKNFQRVGTVQYQARIVATAKERDLALLQIRSEKLPYTVRSKLLPADQRLFRGETVYAVGNPSGLDATVTKGIVSSVNRMFRVPWANNQPVPFIQYDGGTYFGNSGGSMYNDDGYLVGVPAAVVRRTGHLGLAIPVSTVRAFLKDNCYQSVYNEKAKSPAACRKAKADKKKSDK